MYSIKPKRIFYFYLLFTVISCNSPKTEVAKVETLSNDDIKSKIQAQNKIFIAALANNDSVGVANCYTIDAEFMPANEPLTKGRPNIVGKIGEYIRQGMTKYTILETTVFGSGDLVTVQEVFTLRDQNGQNQDIGKSIEMWKIEDGKYKLFRDCFNSDLPIPPCPPDTKNK
jgi:ketosteroid isomerase-like protein